MSDAGHNQKTLQTYEAHIQDYVDGTPKVASGSVTQWIDAALALIPKTGRILEIGSATGRDADYIESRGYHVERTDAVQGFIDLLRAHGHDARLLDATAGNFGGPCDLIYANAVFLHFTPLELKGVLTAAHASLKPTGILAFSVKAGTGTEWSERKLSAPRFFQYWEEAALTASINGAGFTLSAITHYTSDHSQEAWLQVIARLDEEH